jgi:early secretory antigenic target protein ESAT-6
MSKSDSVSVKFEAVSSVEARIGTTLRNLTSELADLEGKLNPIQSHWTGDARQAYAVDKKKWDDAARDMNTVLAQLQKAVNDAHETYVQVNNRTKNLF